jgi:hypothetical protein
MSTQSPPPPLAQTLVPNSPSADFSEFLWNVQRYINEYLRFGDTKAALAVATVSAIIGSLFKINAQKAFLHISGHWGCFAWLSLSAFALLAISAVLGIIAVTPPLKQQKTRGLMYWVEVAAHKDGLDYWNDLRAHSEVERLQVLAQHVFIVSRVCARNTI